MIRRFLFFKSISYIYRGAPRAPCFAVVRLDAKSLNMFRFRLFRCIFFLNRPVPCFYFPLDTSPNLCEGFLVLPWFPIDGFAAQSGCVFISSSQDVHSGWL